jgi:hypothetical protein
LKVELLYFDGCPSHERLLPRLRELVTAADPGAEVELRRIATIKEAKRERFLGSPTVRVDGQDVDPGAEERSDFGMKVPPVSERTRFEPPPAGKLDQRRAYSGG